MTVDEIKAVVDDMRRCGIHRFEYEAGAEKLVLVLSPLAPAAPAFAIPETVRPALSPVKSHAFGRFHRAHPGAALPAPRSGQHVSQGDYVGFIQIGPILLPIIAPKAGSIAGYRAADEDIVEFGTVLLEFDASPMPDRTEQEL